MKPSQILLSFVFCLILDSAAAQISLPLGTEYNNEANVVYYAFYNGIQMIEIDYNNQEKARVDRLDALQPMSSIRKRNYSHNTIIIRNRNGDLLHQYNLRREKFKPSDFIPVKDVPFTFYHSQKAESNTEAKSNYPSYGKYNLYVTENNKAGVIDTLGNKILDVIYDDIIPYESQYGTVSKNEDIFYTINLNGKWGLKTRKLTIKPKYEELVPLKENVLKFKASGHYGLINYKEKVLLAPTYADLQYKNDFYLYRDAITEEAEYGIINSKFKIIAKPVYTLLEGILENYKPSETYWACKVNGCGALNRSGYEISKFKYGEVPSKPYSYYRTSLFEDSSTPCILDSNFKEIGSGYDAIYEWNTELFVVQKNKKQGLIDIAGNVVLPCEYDSIKASSDGFGIVIKDNLYGIINSKGKVIVPCSYSYLYFTNNMIVVTMNTGDAIAGKDKYGLSDYQGKLIIPAIYDKLEFIDTNLLKAQMKQTSGIIDNQGRQITPIKYDDIFSFRNGFCIAKIDFGYGYINSSGKEITHFYYRKPTNFEYNPENKLIAKAYLNDQEITIDENGKALK